MAGHELETHRDRMKLSIPAFYSDKMVAHPASFSPSAGKPSQVIESWLQKGLPVRVVCPTPASVDQLALAHDRGYVDGILSCRSANGFGDTSAEVAASLPWTSGAMLTAARFALESGGAACAPCSGFHHAGFGFGGGFCTFNGLMVTACALRQTSPVRRIGILDCDMHYGNGTDEIIGRLKAGDWVRHFTAGRDFHSPGQVKAFFRWLGNALEQMADCDLVLYQAGADPHVNDPLGGWLTTQELLLRDECVFEATRRLGIPIVWNLAGGYQVEDDGSIPRVLEIHENTMRACASAYGRTI